MNQQWDPVAEKKVTLLLHGVYLLMAIKDFDGQPLSNVYGEMKCLAMTEIVY